MADPQEGDAQVAGPSNQGKNSLGMGDLTMAAADVSPSRVFKPRQQLQRSPIMSSAPLAIDADQTISEEVSMEIDQPTLSTEEAAEIEDAMDVEATVEVEAGPSTTPQKTPPSKSSAARTPVQPTRVSPRIAAQMKTGPSGPAEVQTPAAQTRRRKSRARTPAQMQVLSEPVVPIPIDEAEDAKASKYGKRYESVMYALELAIKGGTQKWTVRDLEQCFPLLSARMGSSIKNVYDGACHNMKSQIQIAAQDLMEQYRAAPALQLLDDVVADAKAHAKAGGGPRPDAWRPDVSPYALTAATNLPIYDEAYARLRTEYLELHDDCAKRYKSIQEKQALLKDIEGSVGEGVVELEETIKLLDNFPDEEMSGWMEQVMGRLEGARA